ncbi:hypothetical protein LRS73_08525 [Methylobacterium currus]|uniref:hypothetical protein n=1 Tax=Methylobacterium currus TaxID=2051553 RepID=UPI001E282A4A|nr:hypothetical protein [Methylobacterium currus]UHC17880.1 hypothetical protein LRS73_08525 [Methylobacterium currus]
MPTERRQRTFTIDNMADILLPLTKAIASLVDQLEDLVDANCRSTNISAEAAEILEDAGNIAIRHSRTLMAELYSRRKEGSGSQII